MLESANRHAAASRAFMGKAHAYLADDDLPQASEKGWGAAAEMVKAIAEERGWRHDSHRLLFRIVRNLANETGDEQLPKSFGLAHNLHINFYENWLPDADVRQSIQDVQELLDRLAPLIEAE